MTATTLPQATPAAIPIPLRKRVLLGLLRIIRPRYFKTLNSRAFCLEVGLSGHVSVLDQGLAKEKGYEPLTKFEKWLLAEDIKNTKAEMWQSWRRTVLEVTGEDPEDGDWG